ncbi:MAG: hypothetical protein O7C39_05715 [Bacteroidetes bacterium]|nr:hypothetical protein [Bacteroidota bacterium]
MKVNSVVANNKKKAFDVEAEAGEFSFPFARLEIIPTPSDRVREVYVDRELANEGFTYVLESGAEGSVLMDQVLDYNHYPPYVREALLYKLTLEVQRAVENCGLSKRELIRQLQTSPAQFYRLLDQTNTNKSLGQLFVLLYLTGHTVEIVVSSSEKGSTRRSPKPKYLSRVSV